MKILLPASLLMLISFSASAKSGCKNLEDCIHKVSKLTKTEYLTTEKLKGRVFYSKNFKLSSENADNFISLILNNNGYTRIPLGENKYDIIRERDVRYRDTPIYKANSDKLPDNHDYIMAEYKFENPIHVKDVVRSMRPFMSRYGRVLTIKSRGVMVIQDTAKNVRRLLTLIRSTDVKPSATMLEKIKEEREHRREISLLEAKNCSSLKSDMQEILNKVKTKI